jgi:eukaryotic-like serine/threonine-protein kinase
MAMSRALSPRPSAINAALDYDLETICLKCLEKDPAKRYASAQALGEDLERWLADEPIQGRRTTRRERTWKWVKRHKLVASLMGFAGATAAAFLVLAGFLWHNAELRAEAVQNLDQAQQQLAAARAEERAAHTDVERLQKAVAQERNNLKKLKLLAELEKARAKEARALADRIMYAADMQSAHAAARNADLPHLLRLLEHHRPAAGAPDLRSFEWRYLWNLAHRARHTLDAHVLKGEQNKTPELGAPTFVAIAPDGQTLASLGADNKIRIWDMASGKLRGETYVPAGLMALEFTEGGKNLQAVSVPSDGKFQMPNPKDFQVGKAPPSLAKLSTKLLIHTWDVASLKHRSEQADLVRLASRPSFITTMMSMLGAMVPLPEGIFTPSALARSPDGKLLALGGFLTISKLNGVTPVVKQEGAILLWDVSKDAPRTLLKGHESMVNTVAFAADGSLVSAGFEGTVKLWNADGKERATLTGNRACLLSVDFSKDGKRLVGGAADGVVYVWETATSKLEHTLIGHREPVSGAAIANDGRTVASASVDGVVKTWDLDTVGGPAPAQFAGTVHEITFSATGKNLFAVDQGGVFRTIDAVTGKEIGQKPLLAKNNILVTAAISPDGSLLAYYNFGKSAVTICDTATGAELLHTLPFKGFNYKLAFSPDSNLLAIGTGLLNKSGHVIVWRRADAKELFRFEDFTHKGSALAFSDDSKILAAGSADGKVVVLDAVTGNVIGRFTRLDPVRALAFAPGGKTLAVADKIGISLHHVQEGKESLAFPTYSHQVTGMVFSPDGKRLATGGEGGDTPRGTGVKLYDVATGRETITLGEPSAVIRSVKFSPDGTRLAAAAGEMSIINNFGQAGGKSVVTIWQTGR